MQLKYLKLEKAVVDYKFENAKLRAELDDYKRVRDVRTIDLNGMEDSLFQNDHNYDGDECENIDGFEHEYDEDEGTGTSFGGNNVKIYQLHSHGNGNTTASHVAMNEMKGPLTMKTLNGRDKGGSKYTATKTTE